MKLDVAPPGARSGSGRPPSWPRRGHYLALAAFVTAAAVYGSLVPFSYRPLALHEAVERFKEIPCLSLGVRHRADLLENVCLFAAISYCWMAALAVDRPGGRRASLAAALVVVLSVALSFAVEFVQLWFPPRTVSQNDLMAEAAGAVLGVGLWLAAGQAVTRWVRSFSDAAHRSEQLDWLLEAYFAALVIWSLVPFDFILSAAELAEKERAGMIRLAPFASSGEAGGLAGLLRAAAVFIPVGMLAATWRTGDGRRPRGLAASVLFGSLAVLAIELAQVAVYTRRAASEDVIAGAAGVLVGAWAMRRWRLRRRATSAPPAANGSAGRAWPWLAMAAAYALVLVAIYCWPLEPTLDPDRIRSRLAGFFSVPFAGLYRTFDLEALADVMKKALFFAPLGAMLARAALLCCVRPIARRVLLTLMLGVAAGVGVVIELVQAFLPPRVPEITDVIFYTAGAAVGMLLACRIFGRPLAGSVARG